MGEFVSYKGVQWLQFYGASISTARFYIKVYATPKQWYQRYMALNINEEDFNELNHHMKNADHHYLLSFEKHNSLNHLNEKDHFQKAKIHFEKFHYTILKIWERKIYGEKRNQKYNRVIKTIINKIIKEE